MVKYDITARAFDRETGDIIGEERVERIDTANNDLFRDVRTIMDVKEQYEEFWNDVNPHSKEVVFVLRIRRVGD